MKFEEFLKKNVYDENSSTQSITDYENGNVVSVNSLGEWAFEKLVFHIKETWTYNNPLSLYYAAEKGITKEKLPKGLALKSAYHEIAVACLGKDEVMKRLSLLSDCDKRDKT